MCGISGFYNLKKSRVESHILQKMLSTQFHRGPDSNDFYHNNHVGLAHNRLSLLDLSINGNQPFKDDEFVLIYNGEIYNFLELKKELPKIDFKSNSDTEVLFHYLKSFGIEKTLKAINGMFAFAWYNIKQDTLFLVRDRIGIKPLFYGVDSKNCLWFASEVKAIHSVTHFETDPIQMILSPIGGIAEKSREKTLWKELKTLTPGHYIKIDDSGITKHQYFNIIDFIDETEYNRLNKMSINEVTDEFEFIFDDSVKRLLISDAPIGAFVSGGIDSSLIAAHASKHQKNFKLFTANVVGKYSEFEDAQRLARTLNKKLYQYDFDKQMAIRDLARVTWHYEAPLVVHFNALPFSNISAIANEQKVKAVLTGEGADELFLGYPRLLTRKYDKLIRTPYSLLDSLYNSFKPLKRYINNSEGSAGIPQIYELAAQGYSRQILREESIGAYSFLNEKSQKDHYLSVQMLNEGIVSLLWRNDRVGMMHSIESRFPFLDEKVIAFGLNLPLKFKIGKTNKIHNYKHPFLIDKHIVRSLGKRSLPSSLYSKKKNGFPLFGLRNMTVKSEFFYNGVFSDLFQLSNKQLDFFVKNTSNYHVALIAMFEEWGKLFIENRTIEEVDYLNLNYLKIE